MYEVGDTVAVDGRTAEVVGTRELIPSHVVTEITVRYDNRLTETVIDDEFDERVELIRERTLADVLRLSIEMEKAK